MAVDKSTGASDEKLAPDDLDWSWCAQIQNQKTPNAVRPTFALPMLAVIALAIALGGGGVLARPLNSQEAAEAAAVLAAAPEQGLPAPDLARAAIEDALISYAMSQHGARIDPSATDPDWALTPEPFDGEAGFRSALDTNTLEAWLESLPPADPQYRSLVDARRRYWRLAQTGGWKTPMPPLGLRRGASGRGVSHLRLRLQAEGYVDEPARGPAVFDAGLDRALRLFQRRHDLTQDGVVTAPVLAALAVPPGALVSVIDANLERRRWLPRDLPGDRIEVNIASAELTLFRGGAPSIVMRTVVGDPAHRTKIFASRATGIVVNPPWNVPTSIMIKELLPREAREPGYLARNDFTFVKGQLRQLAGPKSALGHLKIELDDPYEIYLHDTPQRGFFARDDRALSHGCVRLERPVELAADLLAAQGGTGEQLQSLIAAQATRHIPLQTKIPVYLLYWTAEANADGSVSFHPDRYGWDGELNSAIAAL